jgi:beta-galactosidase
MKRKSVLLLCLISTTVFGQVNFTFKEWQDPSITRLGTLAQQSFSIPYPNEKQALQDAWMKSDNILSLNGTWKFNFANRFVDRAIGFEKEDFNTSNWSNIKVPADWQMEGFDAPIFTNISYPWANNAKPPFIPSNFNPVGSYRRSFNLPANWQNQRVVLHFGGVNSAYYVWVNGNAVGYAEDSKMDAAYDITKFIHAGKNSIAVQVLRFADGTYLEDQDFWRLSGIEREVYLVATPKLFVQDFQCKTLFTNGFSTGTLQTAVSISNQLAALSNAQLDIKLLDEQNQVVATSTTKFGVKSTETTQVESKIVLQHPLLWNAESPHLYKAILVLKDAQGKLIQVFNQQVGFRQVDIKDGKVLVNGQPVLFKGVNRHEHHPEMGHAVVDEADMLLDIQRMKEYNINAVRASHYPNHPLWYKLCNKYGMYIVDEANVESHGMGVYDYQPYGFAMNNILARDAAWFPAIWQRIENMYQRDKNNPAIIFWSLGNEAGRGDNFKKSYDALKLLDHSRPIQYEQAFMDNYTDIVAPMYPVLSEMSAYAASGDKRPYIMCEYAHSMGNSTGNFNEYWDFIESNPQFCGGFIWDWKNQTFSKKTAGGQPYWAWANDLEPLFISKDKGCSDGLVFADGTPEPALEEVKKIYQYIKFKNFNQQKGSFTIENAYAFKTLDDIALSYQLIKNGIMVREGTIAVPLGVKPQQKMNLDIPGYPSTFESGEYFVNLNASLKKAAPLLKKGHSVASEQFVVKEVMPTLLPMTASASSFATIDSSDNGFTWISAKDFSFVFNNKTGFLNAWIYQGKHLIKEPMVPDFWRSPIDNDLGNNMPKRTSVWKNIDAKMLLKNFTAQIENGLVVVRSLSELADSKSEINLEYRISENGSMQVFFDFKTASNVGNNATKGEIPRIGMRLTTFDEFENFSWYGRGPFENYWDRKQGAYVGLYTSKVKDQFVQYEMPQENGAKSDVRWLSLINNNGVGMKVSAQTDLLSVNAQNYRQADLEGKRHPYEVPLSNLVELHIDFKQMGLGGDNSWGRFPHDQYLLKDPAYHYAFLMQPQQIKGNSKP